MENVLFLFGCIAIARAFDSYSFVNTLTEEWKAFKLEYNKQYTSPSEEYFRMQIFVDNRDKIAKHNQQYAEAKESYKLNVNKFTDMLYEEFANAYSGSDPLKAEELNSSIPVLDYMIPANVNLPPAWDWRSKGAVTPVKTQVSNSCWAYATTGSLEGQQFRKTLALVALSEQNLIDCVPGCKSRVRPGNRIGQALLYVIQNGGIDTEKSYPTTSKNNTKCHFNNRTIGATAQGLYRIESGSEDVLKYAVATVGPISAVIKVTKKFMVYSKGVFDDPNCNSDKNRFHSVLVVGYGNDTAAGEYWLVKNSWGKQWGEQGYVRMARNKKNMCGIASSAYFPMV